MPALFAPRTRSIDRPCKRHPSYGTRSSLKIACDTEPGSTDFTSEHARSSGACAARTAGPGPGLENERDIFKGSEAPFLHSLPYSPLGPWASPWYTNLPIWTGYPGQFPTQRMACDAERASSSGPCSNRAKFRGGRAGNGARCQKKREKGARAGCIWAHAYPSINKASDCEAAWLARLPVPGVQARRIVFGGYQPVLGKQIPSASLLYATKVTQGRLKEIN